MKFIKELRQGFKQGRAIFVRGSGIAAGILVVPLVIYGVVYVSKKAFYITSVNTERFSERYLVTDEYKKFRSCRWQNYEKQREALSEKIVKLGLDEFRNRDSFYQERDSNEYKLLKEKFKNLTLTSVCGLRPRKWIWSW